MSSKKTNRSARGLVEAVEENGMPKVCRKYDRVDFSGLLTELQTPQKETAVQSACDGAETKPERQTEKENEKKSSSDDELFSLRRTSYWNACTVRDFYCVIADRIWTINRGAINDLRSEWQGTHKPHRLQLPGGMIFRDYSYSIVGCQERRLKRPVYGWYTVILQKRIGFGKRLCAEEAASVGG